MSISQVKAAFTHELGSAGSCQHCTMQYVDDGAMQRLRFYARIGSGAEEVFELRVPRGESLVAAARAYAKEIRDGLS